MTTPIVDFIDGYIKKRPLRLHTPGHKGEELFGFEKYDITEIDGADELYAPGGIIEESEKNASAVFGVPTYYSTEGSSLCVRAMVQLCCEGNKAPVILAQRNVHRSFIYAAAMTGVDVIWLPPHENDTFSSFTVLPSDVENAVRSSGKRISAVYITTPDYLGKTTDIPAIADVCKRYGIILMADCAHGAYLRFTDGKTFADGCGADIFCTSAHKTLPVLTGGAYLHTRIFDKKKVKAAMAAYASTSPSYLILRSLDAMNGYAAQFKAMLDGFLPAVAGLKSRLSDNGFVLYGDEPLKLTVDAHARGCTGGKMASALIKNDIFPEYREDKFITLMLSPYNGASGLEKLETTLCSIPAGDKIATPVIKPFLPERAMSIREAFFAKKTTLPTVQCAGRVMADARVSCPPAISPVIAGEMIDGRAVSCLLYHGINECEVVT